MQDLLYRRQMYQYLNPVLFVIAVCVLLWRVTSGMEGEGVSGSFDAVFLSVYTTLCVVCLLIGLSRLLTQRGGHRELLWGVAYLLVCATVMVSARASSAEFGEEEYRSYRETFDAWRGGDDPYAANADGETMLTLAASLGRRDVLESILTKSPAPIEQLHKSAQMAASRNYAESLGVLLAHGLNPNELFEGTTVLCAASQNAQLRAVQTLLQAGADPNLADEEGCTPLMHAVMAQHAGVVKLLLEYGADPSAQDRSGRDAASYSTRAAIDDLLHQPPAKQP